MNTKHIFQPLFYCCLILLISIQLACSSDEVPENTVSSMAATNQTWSLACGALASDMKTKRLVGLAVAPSSQEYGQALQDSFEAGSHFFEIPQQWKDVDSPKNTTILQMLSQIMIAHNKPIVLTLNPLDTIENQIPADLLNTNYDDPEFLRRYLEFVEKTLAELAGLEILSISIGNEVDILLGEDPMRWQQYTNFFLKARAHIKQRCPQLKIGVKFTYGGLTNKEALSRPIIENSDCLMMTYYPVGQTSVRPIAGVKKEIEAILETYPNKCLHINEIGYPYSPKLGSSRQVQSQFVEQAFKVFDQNERIELMNFVWINDMPPLAVEQLASSTEDRVMVEALTTLGLRSHLGKTAPAFETFRTKAKAISDR